MNPVKVMNNAKVTFVRPYLNLNEKLRNVLLTDMSNVNSGHFRLISHWCSMINVKQEMTEDDSEEDMF